MTHIANCLRRGVDKLVNVYILKETTSASDMPVDFYCIGDERTSLLGSHIFEDEAKRWQSPLRSPGVPWLEVLSEEKDMALSVGRSVTSLSDTAVGNGRETPVSWRRGGSLSRRRKVSVPELTPTATTTMATVQEAGLDSPTIPGRPPLRQASFDSQPPKEVPGLSGHERSMSAPQHNLNQYSSGEFTNPRQPVPIPQRKYSIDTTQRSQSVSKDVPKTKGQTLNSSKSLSPIFSPAAWSDKKETCTTPPIILLEDDLPLPLKVTPPKATTHPETKIPLRINTTVQRQDSPVEVKPLVPPKPSPASANPLSKTPKTPHTPPRPTAQRPWPMKHSASMQNLRTHPGQVSVPISDISRSTTTSPEKPTATGHSRGASDASVLDRGRPIKRSGSRKKSPSVETTTSPKSEDTNWRLPIGLRPCEAVLRLPDSEKEALHKQASGQAEQFEILGPRNVTALSRELRALDERCEYLRSTYKSLRQGRLKLHTRMITYLKSESLQFSKESLLRQEEALIELDKSIDDWILKLEQAENRRLRVRQKLLEHVAAAMALNPIVTSPQRVNAGPSTPPGSPLRTEHASPSPVNRRDVESIKIYADGQVLNLFSDIEQAVARMCEAC